MQKAEICFTNSTNILNLKKHGNNLKWCSNKTGKKTTCRGNSSKIHSGNQRNRDKINTPSTHVHNDSLFWLGTGISTKSGRVKLVVLVQTYSLNEMLQSSKCLSRVSMFFIHVNVSIFRHNQNARRNFENMKSRNGHNWLPYFTNCTNS